MCCHYATCLWCCVYVHHATNSTKNSLIETLNVKKKSLKITKTFLSLREVRNKQHKQQRALINLGIHAAGSRETKGRMYLYDKSTFVPCH